MRHRFVTAAITAMLACTAIAPVASSDTVSLSANSPSLELSGTSGGPRDSQDCGFVPSRPSQVINVRGGLNRVRLEVNATGGQPTLLVNGPTGRYCVLGSDSNVLQMAGVWQDGRYEVSVGDRAGESHRYTLSVMRR